MNSSHNVYESHNINQSKPDIKHIQYDFIFYYKTLSLRDAWLGDKTKEMKVITKKPG